MTESKPISKSSDNSEKIMDLLQQLQDKMMKRKETEIHNMSVNSTGPINDVLELSSGKLVVSERSTVIEEETKKEDETVNTGTTSTAGTTDSSTLTYDEYSLYKVMSSILTSLLTTNDTKILANILDRSGKIVLSESDIRNIIHTIDPSISVGDVEFDYKSEEVSCCGKVYNKIRLLKFPSSIKIKGKELSAKYTELHNFLINDLNISLSTIYNR